MHEPSSLVHVAIAQHLSPIRLHGHESAPMGTVPSVQLAAVSTQVPFWLLHAGFENNAVTVPILNTSTNTI